MSKKRVSEAKLRSEGLLKPCPFCGGESRLKMHQKFNHSWYVQCNSCRIRTPYARQDETEDPSYNEEYAKKYVVNLWNRRMNEI